MTHDTQTAAFLDQLDQLAPAQIRALAELCETKGRGELPGLAAPLRALAAERTGSTSSC